MERTDWGWKVKTEGGWDVYVLTMLYNFRIVLSFEGNTQDLEAGWCYFGRDHGTMTRTLIAAQDFHDLDDGEPEGYDKCAFDGRAMALMRVR